VEVRMVDMVVNMDESQADMWHVMVGRKGATWPNQGLPHGTPSLVYWLCVKSFGMSSGVEPVTSRWVKYRKSHAS
jgi:hypothetical protein